MEPCEDSSHFISLQITASGSQFVRSSLHESAESVAFKSHADGSHLCDGVAAVDHMLTPSFHGILELGEVCWQLILSYVLHDLSDIVEVSPLGIMGRRRRSLSLVAIDIGSSDIVEITSPLCEFWSSTNLEVKLWEDVGDWSTRIEV